ncbi:MAG: hypothetical protein ACI9TI_000263 [Natronomonas sp.]|jgi:hypothetical protein
MDVAFAVATWLLGSNTVENTVIVALIGWTFGNIEITRKQQPINSVIS